MSGKVLPYSDIMSSRTRTRTTTSLSRATTSDLPMLPTLDTLDDAKDSTNLGDGHDHREALNGDTAIGSYALPSRVSLSSLLLRD